MENSNLPDNRLAAQETGSVRYYTGIPCKRGHLAPRLTNSNHCTECLREQALARYHRHKHENAEKINRRARERYHENIEVEREKKRLSLRRQREKHPDRDKERARLKRLKNPSEARDRQREWRLKNPERAKAASARASRKRRSTPAGQLNANMSSAIRHSILRGAKGRKKWESLVGYTIEQLMEHLERQFLPGMTWDNYGRGGWEIDHKTPLAAHNFSCPEDIDFRRAWALANLQPLWMSNNRSKGTKLTKPFQPSLALAVPANDNKKEDDNAA